jgi:hypothetical protein
MDGLRVLAQLTDALARRDTALRELNSRLARLERCSAKVLSAAVDAPPAVKLRAAISAARAAGVEDRTLDAATVRLEQRLQEGALVASTAEVVAAAREVSYGRDRDAGALLLSSKISTLDEVVQRAKRVIKGSAGATASRREHSSSTSRWAALDAAMTHLSDAKALFERRIRATKRLELAMRGAQVTSTSTGMRGVGAQEMQPHLMEMLQSAIKEAREAYVDHGAIGEAQRVLTNMRAEKAITRQNAVTAGAGRPGSAGVRAHPRGK